MDSTKYKYKKQLPQKSLTTLLKNLNIILRKDYFPSPWKIRQINLIHESGKLGEERTFYGPVCLDITLSTLFEKVFFRDLKPKLDKLMSWGFVKKHE